MPSILNILGMNRSLDERERLAEETRKSIPVSPPEDPEDEVFQWNIYRKARRATRRNRSGLVYLRTADLTVREARKIAAKGFVLRYYYYGSGHEPEGFECCYRPEKKE